MKTSRITRRQVLGAPVAAAAGSVLAALPAAAQKKPRTMLVYVGTYSQRGSKGIYALRMDLDTGALTQLATGPEITNPSFLAIHPNGRYLYAVAEIDDFNGTKTGGVVACGLDRKTGALTKLNQQSSRGAGPCHISLDKNGRNALVANYGGGSVAVLPIDRDGRLREASAFVQHQGSGADRRRQEGPHAHSINLDRANRYAMAADLGLDRVLVYRFDAGKGSLTEAGFGAVEPASGPRHFAFHPDGRHAYVINEMALTVTLFDYDPERGTLKAVQTVSTVPPNAPRNGLSTAEVQVHPSGKFLYGSNRGHDSIAIFRVEKGTGRLTPVGNQSTMGKTPRNFGIDPTGRFLIAANQQSDNLVVFRIDPNTGELAPTGHTLNVPAPVCVKFLPVD